MVPVRRQRQQTSRETHFTKIPFAYKRASAPFPREAGCPVCEQTRQANELLSGSGVFRLRGRLTGFRRARNIVRIRTKYPGGDRHQIINASD
jgi:hypothetical protein